MRQSLEQVGLVDQAVQRETLWPIQPGSASISSAYLAFELLKTWQLTASLTSPRILWAGPLRHVVPILDAGRRTHCPVQRALVTCPPSIAGFILAHRRETFEHTTNPTKKRVDRNGTASLLSRDAEQPKSELGQGRLWLAGG
jgi:hypothetical protein